MATAIPKAYLASSAIRCRDVETGPNLGVLAVFPSTGATCRCPLPSTGSRGLNSPALRRYYETRPTPRRPSPRASLPSARRYHPSTCGHSLRRTPGAASTASGQRLVSRCPPPGGALVDGDDEASRVPGKPTRTHATRSDPGEVAASTASEMRSAAGPRVLEDRPRRHRGLVGAAAHCHHRSRTRQAFVPSQREIPPEPSVQRTTSALTNNAFRGSITRPTGSL